jgi:hypothetical protein
MGNTSLTTGNILPPAGAGKGSLLAAGNYLRVGDYLCAQGREGPQQFGHRLAAMFVEGWEAGTSGAPVLMMFHAAIADPRAASLLREFLKVRMTEPCLGYLDADRPQLRASLIAGQAFGFGITRYLLKLGDEAATAGQLSEVLGRSLQRLATGPL